MKPMFEYIRKLYSGINLINGFYQNGNALDTRIPSPNVMASINRFGDIQNIPVEIELIIDMGDRDNNEPFYIAVVSNDEWKTVVDRILSPSYQPVYLVALPKSIFTTTETNRCISDLYPAYNGLLSFDPVLFVNPDENVINIGDTMYGANISTYDYTMVLGTIAMMYVNICNWWEKDLCLDFIIGYLKLNGYQEDVLENVVAVALKDLNDENILERIGNGNLINVLYH